MKVKTMHIKNQRKAGVVLTYISTIISTLIMFIYTPVMLKILGQSEYGLYTLAMATVNYLSVLSFGFGSAYVKFYTKYSVVDDDEGISSLNGMFLAIFSAIAVLVLILGLLIVFNVESIYGNELEVIEIQRIVTIMIIMIINLAISFPLNILNSYITAKEEFVFQRVMGIIISILIPLTSLILLLMGFKSIALAFVSLGITILNAVIRYFYVKNKLEFRVSFKNFNRPLFKSITNFSILIFINILADQINWSIDKALLGVFQGTKSVAVYGVASSFNRYFRNSVIAGFAVFETKLSIGVANGESNDFFTNFVAKTARIAFIVLVLLLSEFIFFGKEFIVLYYGGVEYINAYIIAILLMGSSLLPLTLHMSAMVQEAKNKHKYRTIIYSLTASFNLIISIPLCKYYGGIGAAWATAIAVIIGDCIFMNIIYQKKVGINVVQILKKLIKIIPALILPLIFGTYVLTFVEIESISILSVYCLIYTGIYFGSFWIFGITNFEKDLIINLADKMWKGIYNIKRHL